VQSDLPFDEVSEKLGLANPAIAEKDYFATQALQAIAEVDAELFTLVFGGGTSLAKAHGVIERMSEDVDFKIVLDPKAADELTGNSLRKKLRDLREKITSALATKGFDFDPDDEAHRASRNSSQYTIYRLPYLSAVSGYAYLRPEIQIETRLCSLRTDVEHLPCASLAATALGHQPEVLSVPCASIVETAAEKLVALVRRTSMQQASGLLDDDPALIRHVYDLHCVHNEFDVPTFADLARDISSQDAADFSGLSPDFSADQQSVALAAVDALMHEPVYAEQYLRFVTEMVYGAKPPFGEALDVVLTLANATWK